MTRLIGRRYERADRQTRRPSATTPTDSLAAGLPIDVLPGLGGLAAAQLPPTIRLECRLVGGCERPNDARFSAATERANAELRLPSQVGYWRF